MPNCFGIIINAEILTSPDGHCHLLLGSDYHLYGEPVCTETEQVNDYLEFVKYMRNVPIYNCLIIIEAGFIRDASSYSIDGTDYVIDWKKPYSGIWHFLADECVNIFSTIYEFFLKKPYKQKGFIDRLYHKAQGKNINIKDIEFRQFLENNFPISIKLAVIEQEVKKLKAHNENLHLFKDSDFDKIDILKKRLKKYSVDQSPSLLLSVKQFIEFTNKFSSSDYCPDDLSDAEFLEEVTCTLLEYKALVEIHLNKNNTHIGLFMGAAHIDRLRPKLISAGWKSVKKSEGLGENIIASVDLEHFLQLPLP